MGVDFYLKLEEVPITGEFNDHPVKYPANTSVSAVTSLLHLDDKATAQPNNNVFEKF